MSTFDRKSQKLLFGFLPVIAGLVIGAFLTLVLRLPWYMGSVVGVLAYFLARAWMPRAWKPRLQNGYSDRVGRWLKKMFR